MKLRNKKTGKIKEVEPITIGGFRSLTELNEEWEDYEGPKDFWFIGEDSYAHSETTTVTQDFANRLKEIGNYFETKEEAEKAVEKLKAWKRLRNKGFRFTFTPGVGALDSEPGKFQIEVTADMPAKWFCCDTVQKDLDLLFGGEDE